MLVLHRRSRVYGKAMEMVRLTGEVAGQLPRGYGFLADQLRRASSSVVLNYAEGSGKLSKAERRRFFRIAKGSAMETAAAFDVGHELGAVDAGANERAQQLCDAIGALLHRCV